MNTTSALKGRVFQKGHDPRRNAGGRPKGKWLYNRIVSWTPALAEELRRIAFESKSDQARINAVVALWNRGYGKPTQSVDMKSTAVSFVARLPHVIEDAEDWERAAAAWQEQEGVGAIDLPPDPPPAEPEPTATSAVHRSNRNNV